MAWVAVAIGGSALLGGIMANKSSKAQEAAAQQSIGEQQRQYDTSRADAAPWRDAGKLSLSRLMELMGLGPQAGAGAMAAPTRQQFTTTTPGSRDSYHS
jgi:hypothetical protein